MELLLDTHTFLWFINDDPRLSPFASERIGDADTRVVVSVVTAWEIVIKIRTGKLALGRPFADLWWESVNENNLEVLDMTIEHVLALDPLPLHHRDPFDRLLVAQAIAEHLQLVSADSALDPYPIQRIW
ncbi:MAG TPA: type II toxin-antitoxin system VapC family toxin [Longimicrobiaceae bacterium]